jgi:RND family efflux transporter MFP subunit
MSCWLFSAVLFSLLLSGCGEKNTYVAPPPPTVTVASPVRQPVTYYARYTGQTEAVESVEIRARVEGYLQSVHFSDAAPVKKGDLLFVIDPRPYQARLDEAQAELAMRQAELRLAEATLKRKESAFEDQAVSEVEVIEARALKDQAEATIAAARAAIETARLDLSYTRIVAPLSGRIGRKLVDVGNLVGASEKTLLATIVSVDPVYVYFNVNERDLLEFQKQHPGHPGPTNGNGNTPIFLGLSNETDYSFEGRVDFTDNRIDPETGTIQVRGRLANPEGILLPGLFARVRIPVRNSEDSLLVPEQALGIDQKGYYLLAVNPENLVEYLPVTVGPLVEGLRVIESGVKADDRIVVNGLQRARPGITVNPVAPSESNASVAAKGPQAG